MQVREIVEHLVGMLEGVAGVDRQHQPVVRRVCTKDNRQERVRCKALGDPHLDAVPGIRIPHAADDQFPSGDVNFTPADVLDLDPLVVRLLTEVEEVEAQGPELRIGLMRIVAVHADGHVQVYLLSRVLSIRRNHDGVGRLGHRSRVVAEANPVRNQVLSVTFQLAPVEAVVAGRHKYPSSPLNRVNGRFGMDHVGEAVAVTADVDRVPCIRVAMLPSAESPAVELVQRVPGCKELIHVPEDVLGTHAHDWRIKA